MRKILLFFFLVPLVLLAQTDLQLCDSCLMRKVIVFLASDSLKGRADGTRENTIAANYIDSLLEQVPRCNVSQMKFRAKTDSSISKLSNVAGFINNRSDSTIVFIAHYDHLGMGGPLSLSHCNGVVHNGADDNASGVALMIFIAFELEKHTSNYNYLFVATSGHENGLYGATYLHANFPQKYAKPALIVNFDMVGRMDFEKSLYYDCSLFAQSKVNDLIGCNQGLAIKKSVSARIEMLDTKPFHLAGIPCVTFSTGIHPDYHKISDDEEFINYRGMMLIYSNMLKWLLNN